MTTRAQNSPLPPILKDVEHPQIPPTVFHSGSACGPDGRNGRLGTVFPAPLSRKWGFVGRPDVVERSVFGLVAYQVAQRPQEFGVHLALGSEAPGLLRLGLGQAGRRTCAGLVLGAGVSVASGRLLASQMFGVSPHDPGLLFMAGGLQLAVALVASFAPARRASRLHPMEALRHE